LDGPAGPFRVASPLEGDLSGLRLPELHLTAGGGGAQGRLELGFADGLNWDGQLELHRLDPAYWLAELPGRLDGTLHSSGSLKGGDFGMTAKVDLHGPLRGQPSRLQAALQGDGQRWQVDALDVRLGDNRVQGQLGWDERLAGQLDIRLQRLGQLWPGLSGSLRGDLELAGNLQAPQGQLRLDGRQLAFGEQRLTSLNLSASLNDEQQGTLDLRAQGLRSGDFDLGTLRIEGHGDRQRQEL